jgi:hypothetical protein
MASPHRNRIKLLGYRDQGNATQAQHQAHWRGFTFNAGRTVVSYCGSWGELQVWAANESEGRRVILHACSIASIPTSGPLAGEWVVTEAKAGRNGQPGAFVVPEAEGVAFVSKRPGPSGAVWL